MSGSEQKGSRQPAVEKLQGELKKALNKAFAGPIIDYLVRRCQEDAGFAEDVMDDKKSFINCSAYIFELAKKEAAGKNNVAVRDDTVFEWSEDYYRMEKAWEPAKGKSNTSPKAAAVQPSGTMPENRDPGKSAKPAGRKENRKSQETKTVSSGSAGKDPKEKKPEEKKPPKPEKKKAEPKKKQSEISGQISLFDLM